MTGTEYVARIDALRNARKAVLKIKLAGLSEHAQVGVELSIAKIDREIFRTGQALVRAQVPNIGALYVS